MKSLPIDDRWAFRKSLENDSKQQQRVQPKHCAHYAPYCCRYDHEVEEAYLFEAHQTGAQQSPCSKKLI